MHYMIVVMVDHGGMQHEIRVECRTHMKLKIKKKSK